MKSSIATKNKLIATAFQVLIKIISIVILLKLASKSFSINEFAHYSQFVNVYQVLTLMSGAWCTTGVVSLLVAANHRADEILSTSFFVSIITSMIFMIILVCIKIFIPNSLSLTNFAYFVLIGLAFISIFNNLILITQSKLNSEGEIQSLNYTLIIVSIVNLVFGVVFYSVMENGLYYYLLCAPPFTFYLVNIKFPILNLLSWKYFSVGVISKLFRFVLMGGVTISCVYIVQIFLREYFIVKYDSRWVGLWQVSFKLSEMYLMLFSSIFAIFVIPLYAKTKTREEKIFISLRVLKFIFPLSLLCAFVQYVASEYIVLFAFDAKYLEAMYFYRVQIISDFIKILALVFCYVFLSTGDVKSYILLELMSCVVLIISCFVFSSFELNYSLNFAYLMQSFTYLLIAIYFIYREKDEKNSFSDN